MPNSRSKQSQNHNYYQRPVIIIITNSQGMSIKLLPYTIVLVVTLCVSMWGPMSHGKMSKVVPNRQNCTMLHNITQSGLKLTCNFAQHLSFLCNFVQLWATLCNFEQLWATLCNFEQFCAFLSNFVQLWATLSNFEQLWATLCNFVQLYATLCNFMQLYATLSNFEQLCATLCNFEQLCATLSNFVQLCVTLCNFVQLWAILSIWDNFGHFPVWHGAYWYETKTCHYPLSCILRSDRQLYYL